MTRPVETANEPPGWARRWAPELDLFQPYCSGTMLVLEHDPTAVLASFGSVAGWIAGPPVTR
jgi:hypothetical protein